MNKRLVNTSEEPVWRVRVTWPSRYRQWCYVVATSLTSALIQARPQLTYGGTFDDAIDLSVYRETSHPKVWVEKV